jgi:hypothetical protein
MTNGQRHWRDDRWLVVLFLLVSLVLVIASIAHASPCRPNGVDVTARLPTGSALQSFPMSGLPHTSSQSERDCLDLTSLDDLHALVIAAGDLAPTAKNKALDALTLAFTRILVVAPYRGALQSPSGGVWIVPVQGSNLPDAADRLRRLPCRADVVVEAHQRGGPLRDDGGSPKHPRRRPDVHPEPACAVRPAAGPAARHRARATVPGRHPEARPGLRERRLHGPCRRPCGARVRGRGEARRHPDVGLSVAAARARALRARLPRRRAMRSLPAGSRPSAATRTGRT